MRRTSSRCDQIIALIDRCLADDEPVVTPPPASLRPQPSARSR